MSETKLPTTLKAEWTGVGEVELHADGPDMERWKFIATVEANHLGADPVTADEAEAIGRRLALAWNSLPGLLAEAEAMHAFLCGTNMDRKHPRMLALAAAIAKAKAS